MYSKYCFDFLKNNYPEFLERKKFEKEENILNLYKNKNIPSNDESKEEKIICKLCRKKEAIERTFQMRSLDEGETLVTHCTHCNKTF